MPKKPRKTPAAARRAPAAGPAATPKRQPVAFAVATGVAALAVFAPELPFTTPYSPRLAGLLLAAAVWAIAWALVPAGPAVPRRRLTLAVLAVAAVTLASTALSATPLTLLTYGSEGGVMGAPSWLALLAVFGLASLAPLGPAVRRASYLVFVWAVPVSAVAVFEALAGRPVSGGFGNGDYLGAALLLVLPLALAAAASEEDAGWRLGYRAGAAIVAAGIVAAGSLAVYAGLGVTAVLVLVLAPWLVGLPASARWRVPAALALAAAAVLVAALGIAFLAGAALPAPLARTADSVFGYTTQTRLDMYGIALGVWGDRPVTGVGPDGFQLASQGHLTRELLAREAGATFGHRALVRDPHSLPLLALASLGLAGLAALVWLAVEWMLALRARLGGWRTDASDPERVLRVGAAVGVVSFCGAELFLPWHVVLGPLPAIVAALAVAAPGGGRTPDGAEGAARTASPAWRAVRIGIAAAVTVAAVWLSADAVLGDSHMQKALRSQTALDAEAEWRKAAAVQPHRPYLRVEQLYAMGRLAQAGAVPLEQYQASVDRAPAEVRLNGGSLAQLVQPSLDQAYLTGRTSTGWEESRLSLAASVAPIHPDVLLERAHLAVVHRRTDEAGRVLDALAKYAGAKQDRYLLYRYYVAVQSRDESASARWAEDVRANAPWLQSLLVAAPAR